MRHLLQGPTRKVLPFAVRGRQAQEPTKGSSGLQPANINSTRGYSFEGEKDLPSSLEAGVWQAPQESLLEAPENTEGNAEESCDDLQSMLDNILAFRQIRPENELSERYCCEEDGLECAEQGIKESQTANKTNAVCTNKLEQQS